MKPEFSEFSYGFAVSYEIANAFRPTHVGAPLFPSLPQEGTSGYDVDFTLNGWPLFLQFKLADFLTTGRAKYFSYHGTPYYRISIRSLKQSNQHNLLRALSEIETDVYYVAPVFYRQSEFNNFFVQDAIFLSSAFISLSGLPVLTDDDQHYITFKNSLEDPSWHSNNALRIQGLLSGEVWIRHLRERFQHPRRLGMDFLGKFRELLIQIIEDFTPQPALFDEISRRLRDHNPTSIVRDVRYLLATYFGVEAIVIQMNPDREQ